MTTLHQIHRLLAAAVRTLATQDGPLRARLLAALPEVLRALDVPCGGELRRALRHVREALTVHGPALRTLDQASDLELKRIAMALADAATLAEIERLLVGQPEESHGAA